MNKVLLALVLLLSIKGNSQPVLNENFEQSKSYFPLGWSQNGNWYTSNDVCEFGGRRYTGVPVGSWYAAINDYVINKANIDKSIITKPVSLVGMSNPVLSFDYFFNWITSGTSIEDFEVMVSTDGNTWSSVIKFFGSVGANWAHHKLSLSGYIGANSLYIKFRYSDNGAWMRGAGIDNIKIYDERTDDVSLEYLNVKNYAGNGSNVSFVCRNLGTAVINSLEVKFSIDGQSDIVETVSGLNILPQQIQTVVLNNKMKGVVPSVGQTIIKVVISKVNGVDDLNYLDNMQIKQFIGASKVEGRDGIIEDFSNRGCPPCRDFDLKFNPIAISNHVNEPKSGLNVIKYHMSFPAFDPNWNGNGEQRRNYYDVNGVPAIYINGYYGGALRSAATNDEMQAILNDSRAEKTPLHIDGTYKVFNDSIAADITITPFFTFTGSYSLFVGLTEKYFYDSVDYSTQKHYYHVMRKMFPDGNGTTINTMTDGVSQNFKFNYNCIIGNVTAGTNNLWTNTKNTDLVIFVQDNATKEILQSASIQPNGSVSTSIPRHSVLDANVYPNPVKEIVNVNIIISSSQEISLFVLDITGKKVFDMKKDMVGGENLFAIPVSYLNNGFYTLQIKGKDQVINKTFSVIK